MSEVRVAASHLNSDSPAAMRRHVLTFDVINFARYDVSVLSPFDIAA